MEIKTRESWIQSGKTFCQFTAPGDFVDREIVEFFMATQPPVHVTSDFLQAGFEKERLYDLSKGRFRSTFPTFVREKGSWVYRGECFLGETSEPPRKLKLVV